MKHRRSILKTALVAAGIALASTTFAQQPPLRIGALNPYSGPLALYGTEVTRGYELAVDRINAAGGVMGGRKIELVRGDVTTPQQGIATVAAGHARQGGHVHWHLHQRHFADRQRCGHALQQALLGNQRRGPAADRAWSAQFRAQRPGRLVAAVGEVEGPGRREIDADGALVAPDWVDIHTHYDGQAT